MRDHRTGQRHGGRHRLPARVAARRPGRRRRSATRTTASAASGRNGAQKTPGGRRTARCGGRRDLRLRAGGLYNLNADDVISGHSDIRSEPVAFAVLSERSRRAGPAADRSSPRPAARPWRCAMRRRLDAGGDAELAEDVRDVGARGLLGDEERLGDLRIRAPGGDKPRTSGSRLCQPERVRAASPGSGTPGLNEAGAAGERARLVGQRRRSQRVREARSPPPPRHPRRRGPPSCGVGLREAQGGRRRAGRCCGRRGPRCRGRLPRRRSRRGRSAACARPRSGRG